MCLAQLNMFGSQHSPFQQGGSNVQHDELKDRGTCFSDICLQSGYSADVAPSTIGNESFITVKMEYSLDNILSVDHDHNILGITLSLRQSWIDNRVFPRNRSMLDNGRWLAAPTRMGRNPETGIPEHIWMPKFYIYWLFEMVIKTNFSAFFRKSSAKIR